MSKKKNYDEVSVLRVLERNPGITIVSRKIIVNNELGTVGNGSWGKIDYLTSRGYVATTNKAEVIGNSGIVRKQTTRMPANNRRSKPVVSDTPNFNIDRNVKIKLGKGK